MTKYRLFDFIHKAGFKMTELNKDRPKIFFKGGQTLRRPVNITLCEYNMDHHYLGSIRAFILKVTAAY